MASLRQERARIARQWEERRALGLCGACGEEVAVGGLALCRGCLNIRWKKHPEPRSDIADFPKGGGMTDEFPRAFRFNIPLRPPSTNDLRRMARRPHIAVLMVRRQWLRWFRPDIVAAARRTLSGPRLVRFIRVMGPREREYDDDNLKGGLKPIRDLLCVGTKKKRGLGMVLDDRKEVSRFEYHQVRGDAPGTIIDIEDLPCPG
jgi:hypothetical protein